MSLPTFKFTNIIGPTNNESVNSGLSSASKMQKAGIISNIKKSIDSKSNIFSDIKDKARETFKEVKMPEVSLDVTDRSSIGDTDGDGVSDGFFSFTTLIKFILVVIIVWFMWSSLSTNGDFHLGMGEFGDKINAFFKSLENKGRELISRITNTPMDPTTVTNDDSDSDSDDNDDSDDNGGGHTSSSVKHRKKGPISGTASATHRPPVPPSMTNSSDKKPGFINDETKYTFLDKAERSYSGPAPRADDSTSVTQKHQTGKGGYCYIGEDRGFRSCVKVEASDKCMSGEVYSREEICIDPTLRE
jgi:hypothetical protein